MAHSSTRTFSRDAVRRVDQLAVERFGVPSIVLMENAARQVADVAQRMVADRPSPRVVVLCGGGNNGGDGLAAVRHLHIRRVHAMGVLLKPRDAYTGDAKTNLAICQAMELTLVDAADEPLETLRNLEPCDLLIDGLLGTGLTSEVRGPARDVIGWINTQPAPVLAVDIPSGLECDTGKPLGLSARADVTVTFVGMKVGFTQPGASKFTGKVIVADIGVPVDFVCPGGEG